METAPGPPTHAIPSWGVSLLAAGVVGGLVVLMLLAGDGRVRSSAAERCFRFGVGAAASWAAWAVAKRLADGGRSEAEAPRVVAGRDHEGVTLAARMERSAAGPPIGGALGGIAAALLIVPFFLEPEDNGGIFLLSAGGAVLGGSLAVIRSDRLRRLAAELRLRGLHLRAAANGFDGLLAAKQSGQNRQGAGRRRPRTRGGRRRRRS